MSYTRLRLCTLLVIFCAISALALAQDHTGVVFLVRHAEKSSDAKDALLSAQGHKRAQCLAHLLGDAGIREILVTKVVRTQQTAEPLARKSGVTPTITDADDIVSVVKKLQTAKHENVLLVGHADTLPKIIEQLGGGQVTIENSDYDKLFVFHYAADGTKGIVVTLRYCDCK